VVDVARPGTNMDRLGRAYGGEAENVTRLAAAFTSGLRARGVLSCAKHFPGLGLARTDEDLRLNRIPASLEDLRAIDEPPFTGAGTHMVMVSTGIYPALDDRSPALFSSRVATDELRGHLGFAGAAITDDLEVPALQSRGSPADRGVAAARAGNDLLLYAQSPVNGFDAAEALERSLEGGTLDRAQFEASARRVMELRGSL
jgi:beta-N-acetylhexosaminidase